MPRTVEGPAKNRQIVAELTELLASARGAGRLNQPEAAKKADPEKPGSKNSPLPDLQLFEAMDDLSLADSAPRKLLQMLIFAIEERGT